MKFLSEFNERVESRKSPSISCEGIRTQNSLQFCSKLVLYIVCGNVALDFISGLFDVSFVSQIIRTAFFFLLLYVELRLDRSVFTVLLLGFVGIVVQSIITQIFSETPMSVSSLSYDIGIGIKFMLSFAVCFSLNSLVRFQYISFRDVKRAISYAAVYLPLLYLISFFLGLGGSSYWDGSGYKSVFSSLNSINVTMIVLFAYAADSFFVKQRIKWAIPLLLNAISLFMLGTKSGYAFAALILLYYILAPKKTRIRNLCIGLILIAVFILLFSQIGYLNELINKVIARQSYLFENRNLFDYLTSGRGWMLNEAFNIYDFSSSPLSIIFGCGYYVFHHKLAIASGYLASAPVRPIEFDWADLLFAYGPLICIVVYSFLAICLYRSWKLREKEHFQFISLFAMVAFGCFGGHVLFEAISSVTLGTVLACTYEENNEESY